MEDHNSSKIDETEFPNYYGFYESLYSPENWYFHARSLYAAAKQTWKRIEELHPDVTRDRSALERVYFMLAGMAIEALLKTNIIARIPEEQRTGQIPKKIKTHNLLKLATILDVELNEDERFCLKNLTDFIVWAGRYPVPANPKDSGIIIDVTHKDIFEVLFKKLSIPYDIIS